MASVGVPRAVATSLQSQDRRELLDVVDRLRSQGIGKYVDLPQIVVCGDQSSGKSSVLEAVSGLPFPVKDNRCTCFATELILRRAATTALRITLHGGESAGKEERERLDSFQKLDSDTNLHLGEVINEAKDFMGLAQHEGSAVFSDNVLRIELSGPEQPHLTIVDLPGLFEAGSRDQSVEDAALVKSLVRSYMERPRTIILAVVSAKNDFNLQSVTKYTRELDPFGARTLGLITKPDTLDRGSEMEAAYLRLASNDDVVFRLGWHVVRNRDYATRNITLDERDKQEKEFFSQGIWTMLDSGQLGVDALRIRLSNVLHNHNLQQLPQVIRDLSVGLDQVKNSLMRFGPPRAGSDDQRYYLLQARQTYSLLIGQAVNGGYIDAYFATGVGSQDFKRLRAIVQNRLAKFSQDMRINGHYWRINDEASELNEADERSITKDEYVEHVKKIVLRSRGRELPGTYNPLVVEELYREQSSCWKGLIDSCINDIVSATYLLVASILAYSTDESTGRALQKCLRHRMHDLQEDVRKKVDELYETSISCHPITYNHYFTDDIRKAQGEAEERRFKHLLQAFVKNGKLQFLDVSAALSTMKLEHVDPDMDRHASEQAIIASRAYYKVARKQMVDDIAKIAVELQFMKRLDSLFDLAFIQNLTIQQLKDIAGETDATIAERNVLLDKESILKEGLIQLQGLRDYQPLDSSSQDGLEAGKHDNQPTNLKHPENVEIVIQAGNDSPTSDTAVQRRNSFSTPLEPLVVDEVFPVCVVPVHEVEDDVDWGTFTKRDKKKKSKW